MNDREINDILVDMTMVRVAEAVLLMAQRIEHGQIPDVGTVETLRNLAKSIVIATTEASQQ